MYVKMIAKVQINYEIDNKTGGFIFKTFSDYEKYIYLPFYYAYYNTAFYRERWHYFDVEDKVLIKERYIDNALYVDVYGKTDSHHIWFFSDRIRSDMYLRSRSRTDFQNHTLQHYQMFQFLQNIFGEDLICPVA